MNDFADMRSLERLEEFLQEAKHFRGSSLKCIEDLNLELRRLTTWIEKEAVEYWQHELVKSRRVFVEAQDALSRCMSYVREDERRPCTEEKKRVKVAKDRRALCEERLQTARGAAKAWDRDRRKNQAKIQRCRDFAESEVTVAIHQLEAQVGTLQEYAGLRSAANKPRTESTNTSPAAETPPNAAAGDVPTANPTSEASNASD
ncbi:MAG: hypothetical protein AAGG44_10105 [Planctomycetota bacterium]